jgi:threonylcarbamoyladenosine tRNA methylthiotransferase MtaB
VKKFKVATLGCRTNQYESQAYADQLVALGYSEAREGEEADLCIINTCTVTESADSHSRHQIRSMARKHPKAKLVVTGCLAESLPEMDEVDLIVINKDKENLLSFVFPEEEELPEFSIKHFAAHTRAFVKVQDGCNSWCSYCILPYVRGRSRSRRVDEILKEIEALIANGYREIVLTGINIGDFDGAPLDHEKPVRLAELVKEVDQLDGLKRLRLSSIDPDEVDEELQETILNGKTTCASLHLVLQSGSNVILKKMNRKYTRQIFLETVERLKKASLDFTFTTDIIVGFPGETEEDFQETLDVMHQVNFAKVHMFPYSVRKRTRAALFPNKVPQEVIQQRKQTVLRLAEETAFILREAYVERRMDVLLEDEQGPYLRGHTENFLSVLVPRDNFSSNQIVTVDLVANHPEGLIGQHVGGLSHVH